MHNQAVFVAERRSATQNIDYEQVEDNPDFVSFDTNFRKWSTLGRNQLTLVMPAAPFSRTRFHWPSLDRPGRRGATTGTTHAKENLGNAAAS
jgi:hypothetical protein